MKGTRDHCDRECSAAQIFGLVECVNQGKRPQRNEKDHAQSEKRQIPTPAACRVSDASKSDKDPTVDTERKEEEEPVGDRRSHLAPHFVSIILPGSGQTVHETPVTFNCAGAEAEEICEIAHQGRDLRKDKRKVSNLKGRTHGPSMLVVDLPQSAISRWADR